MSGSAATFKSYVDFCATLRVERNRRCQSCGRTAEEAGDRKLHPHHLWPVAKSGVSDALVQSRANVLLVCGWCHKLQHPGHRRWLWDLAANLRGAQLSGRK